MITEKKRELNAKEMLAMEYVYNLLRHRYVMEAFHAIKIPYPMEARKVEITLPGGTVSIDYQISVDLPGDDWQWVSLEKFGFNLPRLFRLMGNGGRVLEEKTSYFIPYKTKAGKEGNPIAVNIKADIKDKRYPVVCKGKVYQVLSSHVYHLLCANDPNFSYSYSRVIQLLRKGYLPQQIVDRDKERSSYTRFREQEYDSNIVDWYLHREQVLNPHLYPTVRRRKVRAHLIRYDYPDGDRTLKLKQSHVWHFLLRDFPDFSYSPQRVIQLLNAGKSPLEIVEHCKNRSSTGPVGQKELVYDQNIIDSYYRDLK